jgi:SnoaL-like domain
MMNRRLWTAAAVAVAAALVYVYFFRQSDEGRIRRQLRALSEAVRVEDGAGNPVFRAARLKDAYAHVFTPRVEVDVPELSREPMRREELVSGTLSVEAPFQAASLDFTSVRVDIDERTASARVTGAAAFVGVEGGQKRVEKRDFSMRFEKADGEWRIAAVSAMPSP